MRQLIDLLNSITGTAARLPSRLLASGTSSSSAAPAPAPAAGSNLSTRAQRSSGGAPATTDPHASCSSSCGVPANKPPLPMSGTQSQALLALRAAEAALEAKLADGAAACSREYLQLHILNERLCREGSFKDAEARRGLNRYCDVLPYDHNRVHLGQPACLLRGSDSTRSSGSSSAASSSRSSSASLSPQPMGGVGSMHVRTAGEAVAAGGARSAAAAAAAGGAKGATGLAGVAGGPPVDYINASAVVAISQGDIPWAYIAAQGPLKHTRDAFWQMAVEQGCSAVVMLTNTVERGVAKCAPYFAPAPRTAHAFGRFTVSTLAAEQLLPDLERRSLAVKDCQGQPGSGAPQLKRPLEQPGSRRGDTEGAAVAEAAAAVTPAAQRARHTTTLTHYHYTAWPDHGVPPSAEPLLALCQDLRSAGAHAAPILVHCSAGIGRSGVFCVLDVITRRLLHLRDGPAAGVGREAAAAAGAAAVDVGALVADLRQQRLGMVQTREQYVFCHTALLHFVRQLAAERHPQNDAQQQAQ